MIHQMERHSHEQTYFPFLYNPIGLYAVNKAVQFVPYVSRERVFRHQSRGFSGDRAGQVKSIGRIMNRVMRCGSPQCLDDMSHTMVQF